MTRLVVGSSESPRLHTRLIVQHTIDPYSRHLRPRVHWFLLHHSPSRRRGQCGARAGIWWYGRANHRRASPHATHCSAHDRSLFTTSSSSDPLASPHEGEDGVNRDRSCAEQRVATGPVASLTLSAAGQCGGRRSASNSVLQLHTTCGGRVRRPIRADGKQWRCRPGTAVKLLWPAGNPEKIGRLKPYIGFLGYPKPALAEPGRYHKKLPNSPAHNLARLTRLPRGPTRPNTLRWGGGGVDGGGEQRTWCGRSAAGEGVWLR